MRICLASTADALGNAAALASRSTTQQRTCQPQGACNMTWRLQATRPAILTKACKSNANRACNTTHSLHTVSRQPATLTNKTQHAQRRRQKQAASPAWGHLGNISSHWAPQQSWRSCAWPHNIAGAGPDFFLLRGQPRQINMHATCRKQKQPAAGTHA